MVSTPSFTLQFSGLEVGYHVNLEVLSQSALRRDATDIFISTESARMPCIPTSPHNPTIKGQLLLVASHSTDPH